MKRILITGGAGFIGTHLVKHFVRKYPQYQIFNLDALTYAGNLNNLIDIVDESNYHFIKADIRDFELLQSIFSKHQITDVIHLAAESHVDRSITNPFEFLNTNIIGTANLLHAAKEYWQAEEGHVFHHVSTDEVYGSLEDEGFFREDTPYDPRSPYSASKASSDMIVRAYAHTYKLPIKLSNCSNNYGPYQFPEKLIPLIIYNIVQKKNLPIYGDGKNVRDWLYVTDHVEALDMIFHQGVLGESYNIGGNNEKQNIELVLDLCRMVDNELGRQVGDASSRITYVTDRKGHDRRYAIDPTKIQEALGWSPKTSVEHGLLLTVKWYLSNEKWLENVTSGDYQRYYTQHYSQSN